MACQAALVSPRLQLRKNREYLMQQPYSVRRAKASDVANILKIERSGFGVWAWDRKLFAEYLIDAGELFLVAEYDGKVVGYSIVWLSGILRKRAELDSIAIAPRHRGKGASEALLAATLR